MKLPKPKKDAPLKGRSFKEFMLEKKRAACVVCCLPKSVQKQLGGRNPRSSINFVLEWLELEHGIKLTRAEWDRHWRERHMPGALAGRR